MRRDGDALAVSGVVAAASVPALWAQAAPLRAGATRLDLHAVSAVDSAGLALLAELADAGGLTVDGSPPGLADLCGAYRLTPALGFVSA
ncbi:STAS domain-containing protein [Luteimonas sp. SJ-16]|uniref:STAS domain-containing protein n=1 Tax=Luteimonas deserti TaxID=2752306 RepID=A0A7Z0TTN1_9GAMM|nr:STAS domain-containing protein [Luteimonas deserti]